MNNPFKLFVDDVRPIPAGWLGARTVSEAISVLANLPVSEVSLDHDIIFPRQSDDFYQALSNETFKGVAYYIAQMPKKPVVRIHTSNIGAAFTLCEILDLDFDETYQLYTPENY